MKRHVVRGFHWTFRLTVSLSCAVVGGFLLMSGYESVYSRSLPLVHTVDPVNLSSYAKSYDLSHAYTHTADLFGSYGTPIKLKITGTGQRFNIAPAIEADGAWLGRVNIMHALVTTPPRDGTIGTLLLYCRAGPRTFNAQNMPVVGSNMFMDTDSGWRYVFKVGSVHLLPDSTEFIASDPGDTTHLIVSCNDAVKHANYVIEATALSVQGLGQ